MRGKRQQLDRSGPALRVGAASAALVLAGLLVAPAPAVAQRIENGTAVFAALDKVTARISKLEVKLGETVRFGALKLTPRACYTRQPTEPPKTTSFVEVQEIQLDGKEQRIFSGWMFAESPGLNAVEHPVFDVWLTDCNSPARPVAQQKSPPLQAAGAKAGQQQPSGAVGEEPAPEEPVRRQRPRR